jgi:hypothetical protein
MDISRVNFGQTHFGNAQLGNLKRTKRLVRIADRIAAHPGGSLPEKMQSPAELEALYHLMKCPKVTHETVLQTHYDRTRRAIEESPGVVCIAHDDTELDFTGKLSLKDELGSLSGKHQRGYICHNSIAVSAAGQPLGLARQILHVRRRRVKKTPRPAYRKDPQRESRLWKRGRQAIGAFPGKVVVDLVDRGGDAFEFLDFEHEHGYLYVVRSKSNRVCRIGHDAKSPGPEVKLHKYLRCLPEVGRRPLTVNPQPAKKGRPAQPGRQTEVALAWAALTLRPPVPGQARGEHRQEPLQVWGLRVWEPAPPVGMEALEWLLLSNAAVTSEKDAWERVDWYELRWPTAEEYHKAQKTGCKIEGPQFTKAERLQPMIGLLSVVAWLLIYLRWASRDEQAAQEPARRHVPWVWVKWLSRWRCGIAQPDWSTREFFLALARLGGHQNRKSDGLPGWQTLWKGWTKLLTVVDFTHIESG